MLSIRKKLPRKIADLHILQWANQKKLIKNFSKGINLVHKLAWDEHPIEMVSPIHFAAAKANTDSTQWILNQRELPLGYINLQTDSGLAPLHFSVLFGNFEVLQLLLDHGAEINIKDGTYGYTALHFAVKYVKLAAVRILLSCAINVTVEDNYGNTAKQLAIKENKQSILKLLTQQEEEQEFKLNLRSMVKFKEETKVDIELVKGQIADLQEQMTKFSNPNSSWRTLPDFRTSRLTMDSGRGTDIPSEFDDSESHCQYQYKDAIKLQKNFETFKRDMAPDNIISKLFTCGKIDINFKSRVKSEKIPMEKNEMIIDLILSRDKPTFDAFVEALKQSGQCQLAKLLQSQQKQNNSCPNICNLFERSANDGYFSSKRATSHPELSEVSFSLLPEDKQTDISCDTLTSDINGIAVSHDKRTKMDEISGSSISHHRDLIVNDTKNVKATEVNTHCNQPVATGVQEKSSFENKDAHVEEKLIHKDKNNTHKENLISHTDRSYIGTLYSSADPTRYKEQCKSHTLNRSNYANQRYSADVNTTSHTVQSYTSGENTTNHEHQRYSNLVLKNTLYSSADPTRYKEQCKSHTLNRSNYANQRYSADVNTTSHTVQSYTSGENTTNHEHQRYSNLVLKNTLQNHGDLVNDGTINNNQKVMSRMTFISGKDQGFRNRDLNKPGEHEYEKTAYNYRSTNVVTGFAPNEVSKRKPTEKYSQNMRQYDSSKMRKPNPKKIEFTQLNDSPSTMLPLGSQIPMRYHTLPKENDAGNYGHFSSTYGIGRRCDPPTYHADKQPKWKPLVRESGKVKEMITLFSKQQF